MAFCLAAAAPLTNQLGSLAEAYKGQAVLITQFLASAFVGYYFWSVLLMLSGDIIGVVVGGAVGAALVPAAQFVTTGHAGFNARTIGSAVVAAVSAQKSAISGTPAVMAPAKREGSTRMRPVRPVTRALWSGGEGFGLLASSPLCEICTGHSCKELRGVEDRGRRVRNARSVAVDGRIGAHDPPRFAGGLPDRYEHRLLPVCCPASSTRLRDQNLIRRRASSQVPELDRYRPAVPPVGDC